MPSPYLSKSDFKACFDCRTRLFYRKREYPTNRDENEYLQFLADGGFMIETIAKAQYPHGVELVAERDPQRALARTQALIAAGTDAVVFEAAVIWEKFHARIDILRREGDTLHLIEVKSSSIDSREIDSTVSLFLDRKGQVSTAWKPYVLDVAFQARVLRHAFPDFKVKPWLYLVDKAYPVAAGETMARFHLSHEEGNTSARPTVIYSGNLAQLRGTRLLRLCDASLATEQLMPEVEAKADALAELLPAGGGVTRVQEPVADCYKNCRICEYRFRVGHAVKPHGFAECWGAMADVQPHILDLYRVGQIGSGKFPDPVPPLLARGRASLLDLRTEELGTDGTRQVRRHLQWSHSGNGGSEHLPEILRTTLLGHQTTPGWPLHFVDFEACDLALPHHAGLRPYERVAFQWSCHSVDSKGNLAHAEWLNPGRDFPNFAFAQSLRQQIGIKGTVYVWSPYEQSTLNRVLTQIEEWVRRDAQEAVRVSGLRDLEELNALARWLDELLGPANARGKRHSLRIRDLHQLALEHYFHPTMLGRTSIKVVLPAVWGQSAAVRLHPWFAQYLKLDEHGQPLDPYQTLPPLPLGEDGADDDVVTEGTGAIRIYQDLIFRSDTDPQLRGSREQLLKQYCRLDTAAMVMIWRHWSGL